MDNLIKGFVHVHTEFSRDGLCSVAELADFARGSGFRFVGLTDHAEDISPGDMVNLRRECEKHSDAECIMISGLEFRCKGDTHILGLGITDTIAHDDPMVVASEIGAKGGLAILAHPARNGYRVPRDLYAVINGIEIWNAAYDGRFVPPLTGFRLVREARMCNPAIFGIGGADLHALSQDPGVVLEIPTNGKVEVTERMVVTHLATGHFTVRGRYVRFGSMTKLHRLARARLWSFRMVYEVSRDVRNAVMGES